MTARLSLEDVAVALQGRVVAGPVTAAWLAGTLVALVGPNGAGKSSLLRAVAGLAPADGRVTVDGESLAALPTAARARRIGYLPQGQRVDVALTARDVVALGRWPHGLTDPARPRPADDAAITRAMAATGSAGLADRPVTALSGGERARVLIARVLATETPVVLADEPTAALDPRYQLEVMALLRAIAAEGRVVVAVTHDLTHAARFADQVLLLDAGRPVASGHPDEVLTAARIREVFGVATVPVVVEGRSHALPWEPAP